MTIIPLPVCENEPHAERLRAAYETLPVQREQGLDLLRELASEGSPLSMLYLVDELLKNDSELAEAVQWASKLSEFGFIYGMHLKGHLLSKLTKSNNALDAFLEAAKAGFLPSMFRASQILIDNKFDKSHTKEGLTLLNTAAKRGHLFAKRRVAQMKATGYFGIYLIPVGLLEFGLLFGQLLVMTINGSGKAMSEFDDRIVC